MRKSILSFTGDSLFDLFSTEEVEAMCVAKGKPIVDSDVETRAVSNEVTEVVNETELEELDYTEEDEVNYLYKEERILSLAKEKLEKLESKYALTGLEELLVQYMHAEKGFLMDRVADAFRNILKAASEGMLVELSNYLSMPGKYHLLVEEVEDEEELNDTYWYISSVYRRTRPRLFRVTFTECGYSPMVIYGTYLKANTEGGKRGRSWRCDRGTFCYCDFGYFFSRFLLYKKGMGKIADMSTKALKDEQAKPCNAGELFMLFADSGYDMSQYDNRVVLGDTLNATLRQKVSAFLQKFPFVEILDISVREYNKEVRTAEALKKEGIHRTVPFLLKRNNILQLLNGVFPLVYPKDYNGLCFVHNYLGEGDYGYFPLIHEWELPGVFKEALSEFLQKKVEVHSYVKELRKASSSYAKSCDTKKNIPEKVQLEMRRSVLNSYFGFVEFDEMCDLDKTRELSKECIALLDNFFGFMREDTMKNSIRFRRLGNHHAAGLYYAGVRCLCVDVASPSSFVHEFGHLIDYTAQYSLKDDFGEIRRMYGRYIDGLPEEEKGIFTKKYGPDYYKKPTEVFARSFELYVTERLGVLNSLVETEYGIVYPKNNTLYMEKVFGYFDALFEALRNNVEGGNADGKRENICANIG